LLHSFILKTLVFIEAHNSKQPAPSYTLGHNQFSDLTLDEYQEFNKLGSYSPGLMTPFRARSDEPVATATKLRKNRRLHDVPDSVDWVEKGAIVPVKNQGERTNEITFFHV
jgi:cathepsin L/xylem cysteine proteinase